MRTLKTRFFSVSAKIIIVYCSIIIVFTFAFLANYYMSKVEIDNKLTKVNEEYFTNKIDYIERTFKDIKNNAYELRNYISSIKAADFADPIEKFDQISRLSRLINYYDYLDDVFIYNTNTNYFITSQGSMDIKVYFRTSFLEESLKDKWKEMSGNKGDIIINVTKFPEYELLERKDFYKRLLYVDIDSYMGSNFIIGFIINIENVIKNENHKNSDISNFFAIKNDNPDALEKFLFNTLEYKSREPFKTDGSIGLLKIKNNNVFYQYDSKRALIYLNAVNMEQYYQRLGYFNFLPVIITALLLMLTIVVASSFLSKFSRNLQSIRTFIEGDFVKSILEKQPGNKFIGDVKDFIGLRGIRQINAMMLSASLKSVNINQIETHNYYKAFDRFLAVSGISFKSFNFIKLKRIYIIDATSIKNFSQIARSIQKMLIDNYEADETMSVNIYISGIYNETDGIEKAINELVYLSENAPVKITNKVVLLEKDIQKDYQYMPDEFKNMLKNAFACGDKQSVLSLISDLLNKNIENGICSRNFKTIVNQINNIVQEILFERYTENYADSVKVINKINNLVDEVGAPYIIPLYEELISGIHCVLPDESKGKNKLQQCFTSYIEDNFSKDIYLETMAEYFNLSAKYVSSKFKEVTGENFTDYLKNYRINAAKQMLKNTQHKINTISEKVGYNNVNVFIRHFKSMEGITPKSYREIN